MLAMIIPAFAQDASEASEVIFSNEYLSIIVNVVLTVLGLVFTWVGKLAIAKMKKLGLNEDAIDDISTAVTKVYHDFVKEAKEASKDGRLTNKEASHARTLARNALMGIAKGPVKEYILGKGKDWVVGKIEDIISAKRGK